MIIDLKPRIEKETELELTEMYSYVEIIDKEMN